MPLRCVPVFLLIALYREGEPPGEPAGLLALFAKKTDNPVLQPERTDPDDANEITDPADRRVARPDRRRAPPTPRRRASPGSPWPRSPTPGIAATRRHGWRRTSCRTRRTGVTGPRTSTRPRRPTGATAPASAAPSTTARPSARCASWRGRSSPPAGPDIATPSPGHSTTSLAAQYPNGGWPQSYPPGKGYARHITFNDNTMVNLLELVRDVARSDAFRFVDRRAATPPIGPSRRGSPASLSARSGSTAG